MKKLVLTLVMFFSAFALSQAVYAVQPIPKSQHLKSKCVNLEDATDFDFVDSLSILLYTTKRAYLVSVEPCEALEVAMGIGFAYANPGKLCANDEVITYGLNSEVLQFCTITSIVPVKHSHFH